MDRRKFAKAALGVVAAGAVAAKATARPEQVDAVKPQDKPLRLNEAAPDDLAEEQVKVIQSKRAYRHQGLKGANGKAPKLGKCTSFLIFADVHLVYKHLAVVRDFYNTHKKYIDDPLHLGDTVGGNLDTRTPFDFWDVFPNSLNVIGNHDTYYPREKGQKEHPTIPDKIKYDTYFKKYIASWNVVQPENAEAEGKCYWHKDYNDDIRLIGIDCMRFTDKTQLEWFAKVLDEAIEKKLKVVVATHVPPLVKEKDIVKCNFSSLDYTSIDNPMMKNFVAILDTFIEKGGTFVCWLCGHLHHDEVGYASQAKHKQLVFVVECATDFMWWTDANHVVGTATGGAWEIFSIESDPDIVKIARFGNNYDHYLRHKGTFCYDYKNHKIISQY